MIVTRGVGPAVVLPSVGFGKFVPSTIVVFIVDSLIQLQQLGVVTIIRNILKDTICRVNLFITKTKFFDLCG